jgi:predicted  nucleic acid-binding Zn-ribbon protein
LSLQDQLRELYRLDSQVRGLRRRLDAAIRRRDAQQSKLDQLRQQHGELAEQQQHLKAKQHNLEQEAQQKQQQIDTHREQMNTITSNKQYSAMLVEIDSLKNEKARLEDQALEKMNELEAVNQRHQELEQKLAEQQKLVDQSEGDVQEAESEVGGRLEELTRERDEAAATVPEETRTNFDRLAEAYDGEAMAAVEEEDRRRMEYNCGGCFISLPVEHVNAVITNPDKVTICPNCRRILYVDQELAAAMKPKSKS